MSERRAMIILAEASADGPVHCRGWEVTADRGGRLAGSLTEAAGHPPLEWLWDETPDGRQLRFGPADL